MSEPLLPPASKPEQPLAHYTICSLDQVADRGASFRFKVEIAGKLRAAFVLCYNGAYYAYLNECAHLPVEMDWQPGDFWGMERETILCAMHGATYLPDTGLCIRGPCKGMSLTPLRLWVQGDQLVTEYPVSADV